MKSVKATCLKEIACNSDIQAISAQMNNLEKHCLEFAPWSNYPYKPSVSFSIAHANDCILLKYFVKEKFIRAAAGNINGNVWEDACVEFFVSFDNSGYYNIEMNCIGTVLIGFGKEKNTRTRLDKKIIEKIKYGVSIQNQSSGNINWEITAMIPAEVFTHHSPKPLTGTQCNANFYKCGDMLEEPHFLSWSNINSPQPNFHLPEFFGTLIFE